MCRVGVAHRDDGRLPVVGIVESFMVLVAGHSSLLLVGEAGDSSVLYDLGVIVALIAVARRSDCPDFEVGIFGYLAFGNVKTGPG